MDVTPRAPAQPRAGPQIRRQRDRSVVELALAELLGPLLSSGAFENAPVPRPMSSSPEEHAAKASAVARTEQSMHSKAAKARP